MTGEEFCNIARGTVIIDKNGYPYIIGNDHLFPDNPDEPFSIIRFHKFNYLGARIATEEETHNFFKKLKEHGYIWNSDNNDIEKTPKRIENEDLLLEDLSCRLKYGVKCDRLGQAYPLVGIKTKPYVQFELERGEGDTAFYTANEIKPYLRPMSSMTEEEKDVCLNEYYKDWKCETIKEGNMHDIGCVTIAFYSHIDWLISNHFDYRGLIPMGLALPAPEGMYIKKESNMKDLVCDCSWLEEISKSANNEEGVVVEFEDGSQATIKELSSEDMYK